MRSRKSVEGWRIRALSDVTEAEWLVWDGLNREVGADTPVLSSLFAKLVCAAFAPPSTMLASFESSGGTEAMLLVHRVGKFDWQVACPGQACLGFALVRPEFLREALPAALSSLLNSLPGLAWRLIIPKQDSTSGQFAEMTGNGGESRQHAITTSVTTSMGFDAFWAERHSEVRRTVRRTEKRLAERGSEHELLCVRDPSAMRQVVADHGALESAGWKGQEGTAISSTNLQGKLYTELMTEFAGGPGAVGYQLLIDGCVAASLLTICQGSTQAVLKTTYDERFAKFGVGRYMDYVMYRQVFAESTGILIENYTSASSVDRRWCNRERPILDMDYVGPKPVRTLRACARYLNRFRSATYRK